MRAPIGAVQGVPATLAGGGGALAVCTSAPAHAWRSWHTLSAVSALGVLKQWKHGGCGAFRWTPRVVVLLRYCASQLRGKQLEATFPDSTELRPMHADPRTLAESSQPVCLFIGKTPMGVAKWDDGASLRVQIVASVYTLCCCTLLRVYTS